VSALDLFSAAAFAVFVWWFCTGVIFFLDGLPRRTYGISLVGATLVAVCAGIATITSSRIESEATAYAAFTCAVLIWGWQEMFFLMGVLAGPSKSPCPPGVSESTRFRLAARAVIHHELALVAVGLLLVALTWRSPNQVAAFTYGLLWLMRLSAKLNLFFGVRNTYVHLLPDHIAYLGSFFKQRATVSKFFIGSISFALVLAAALWLYWAYGTTQTGAQTGLALLATLTTLAVIEHFFLVLPIPMERLWKTALAGRGTRHDKTATSGGQSPHEPSSPGTRVTAAELSSAVK
jgi:putative photosynthetic complex assembly protein 2